MVRALDRLPAPVLALGGVVSLQCGAAVPTGLFAVAGIAGAVTLRLGLAAVMLCAWWAAPAVR